MELNYQNYLIKYFLFYKYSNLKSIILKIFYKNKFFLNFNKKLSYKTFEKKLINNINKGKSDLAKVNYLLRKSKIAYLLEIKKVF